ncbi:hypothetical protein GW17_00040007 [Ensete ventricosum]|nr:hypothetical protein GW17_00040007 [Ensete ventricosum]
METLHLDPVVPPSSSSASTAPRGFFTAAELAAAERLVQLSADSGTLSVTATAEERTSSSSPRSVNARPPPEVTFLMENVEEDDDEEIRPRRRTPRYRPIADIYAATRPVDRVTRICGVQRRKKKRTRGED